MKKLALFLLLFLLWTVDCRPSTAAERPNFLIVLCDDLGYGDLACYRQAALSDAKGDARGGDFLYTPNVDAFAAESLRLTNCYAAAANCSPARTGLMTGRTPYRVGIHNWIPGGCPMHMRRSEITIATLLRGQGYDTCHSGKWHLNGGLTMPDQPQPGDHGFNHWFSTQNNALPNHRNPDNFVRNGVEVGQLEGFSAHLVADEAIEWLKNRRDKSTAADREAVRRNPKRSAGTPQSVRASGEQDKPFFLFTCFHEPHEPIASAPEHMAHYKDIAKGNESYLQHHGNITQMDAAFGKLIKAVDDLGLRDNTFVFFTSDNGPAITGRHPHGSSGPLRDKKGAVYEGGIRVPGIIRWPGKTKPGSTSDTPVCGVDLLPTLCAITGVPVPSDRVIDGTSILPLFENKPVERATPLYWQYSWSRSTPKVALRDGDWKILATFGDGSPFTGAGITDEQTARLVNEPPTGFELYNIAEDIAETTDLSTTHPERLAEMKKKLIAMHRDVLDESPTWPAWEWPRYESSRIQWGDYKGQPLEK